MKCVTNNLIYEQYEFIGQGHPETYKDHSRVFVMLELVGNDSSSVILTDLVLNIWQFSIYNMAENDHFEIRGQGHSKMLQ